MLEPKRNNAVGNLALAVDSSQSTYELEARARAAQSGRPDIAAMERAKQAAIANEDYLAAARIKDDIDRARAGGLPIPALGSGRSAGAPALPRLTPSATVPALPSSAL